MAKNIVVFGAGAMGSSIAGYLTRAGIEITVIDPWHTHIAAIQKRGIHVTDPDGEFVAKPKALHVDQVKNLGAPIDILFLAVKSPDTEWATRYLAPYLAPDGYIVSAQNSLNEETISSIVGPEKVVGLVITIAAAVYEPGELLRYTAPADKLSYHPGELDGTDTPRLQEVAELLSAAGLTKATDNIWGTLWAKLAHNNMFNVTAGLTGLSSNPMFNNGTARDVMMQIGRESVTVGEAYGIKFDNIAGISPEHFKNLNHGGAKAIEEAMLQIAAFRTGVRNSRPSMLQDILKGRRTEVDYLNGLIVRKGKEKNMPTPVNQAMLDAMHRLEDGEIKSDPSNLELFKGLI